MFSYVEKKVSKFLEKNNYQCSYILTTDLFIWLAFGVFYLIHFIVKFILYLKDKESSLKKKNKHLFYTVFTLEIIVFLLIISIILYFTSKYFIE